MPGKPGDYLPSSQFLFPIKHRWLSAVGFNYKPGYKPCDLLNINLVESTAFRLERIFQPMRALKFIRGHMVYNLAYN